MAALHRELLALLRSGESGPRAFPPRRSARSTRASPGNRRSSAGCCGRARSRRRLASRRRRPGRPAPRARVLAPEIQPVREDQAALGIGDGHSRERRRRRLLAGSRLAVGASSGAARTPAGRRASVVPIDGRRDGAFGSQRGQPVASGDRHRFAAWVDQKVEEHETALQYYGASWSHTRRRAGNQQHHRSTFNVRRGTRSRIRSEA
jgi:hypothetical protein